MQIKYLIGYSSVWITKIKVCYFNSIFKKRIDFRSFSKGSLFFLLILKDCTLKRHRNSNIQKAIVFFNDFKIFFYDVLLRWHFFNWALLLWRNLLWRFFFDIFYLSAFFSSFFERFFLRSNL